MKYLFAILIAVGLVVPTSLSAQISASEQLGMAIEYFQSQKYHEALLLFQRLDKQYQLNPRYRAYIGVCYYYEYEYQLACKYLDENIPLLDGFAPHERSIYYMLNAESHFNLNQYNVAIPYYEQTLGVCYAREKGDVLFKLGSCYMLLDSLPKALDCFEQSLDNYKQNAGPNREQRMAQLETMIKGIKRQLPAPPDIELPDTAALQIPDSMLQIPVDTTEQSEIIYFDQ